MKYGLIAFPFLIITAFYLLISQSTSSVISFSAWTMSITFVFVSMWILCEILQKDVGPKAMQDIAEVIREGSEGFFVT